MFSDFKSRQKNQVKPITLKRKLIITNAYRQTKLLSIYVTNNIESHYKIFCQITIIEIS